MDLYAENILDHYRTPRHVGEGNGATISAKEINPSCGDELTVHLFFENDVLTKLEWEGVGCAISQAGMSILSEELIGKHETDIAALRKDDIYELLGVPIGPRRYKCALLCLHTVKNALRALHSESPQSWLKTVEIDE